MTLKTEAALEALKDALVAAAGADLPECTRNDDVLERFAAKGPGLAWRLHMADGNIRGVTELMGGGDRYEMEQLADITFAVEGEPGGDRSEILEAGLAALHGALFPDGVGLTVEGVFDDVAIAGEIVRKHIPSDGGRQPIAAWEFTVALTLTAPTPFG